MSLLGESLNLKRHLQTLSVTCVALSYLSHELRHCIEVSNRYILLVQWRKLEDHTEGFRNSTQYQHWRKALHPFYDPFPTVEHYRLVEAGTA